MWRAGTDSEMDGVQMRARLMYACGCSRFLMHVVDKYDERSEARGLGKQKPRLRNENDAGPAPGRAPPSRTALITGGIRTTSVTPSQYLQP